MVGVLLLGLSDKMIISRNKRTAYKRKNELCRAVKPHPSISTYPEHHKSVLNTELKFIVRGLSCPNVWGVVWWRDLP